MKVAFLIGAGMANVAGMPTTQAITQYVLTPFEGYPTGEHLQSMALHLSEDAETFRVPISHLLKILKNEADAGFFNLPNKISNYEDLNYLLDKLPVENDPLVTHFRNKLISQIAPILLNNDNTKMSLFELTERSKIFIRDVVRSLINLQSFHENESDSQNEENRNRAFEKQEQAYRVFCNVEKDTDVEEIHVFNLNHDLTLEDYLRRKNIGFNDGFRRENENVIILRGDGYAFSNDFSSAFNIKMKVNSYKLHGSVDWWEASENGTSVLLKASNQYSIQNFQKGEAKSLRFSPNNVRGPIFLTGTINKITEYTQGIFHRLYSLFIDRLIECDLLVIVGFGFGDGGIRAVAARSRYRGAHGPPSPIGADRQKAHRRRVRRDHRIERQGHAPTGGRRRVDARHDEE